MPQNISQKNYFFFRFWRAIFYWSSDGNSLDMV
jgi:hypothetical protein